MKIVVVSPHRDDAAFSLHLSIEHWLAAGHKVHVLNCFTLSEYAPYSDVKSLHANDRRSYVSAIRKREDVAWNKLLGGRLQIADLDLLDAPLRLAVGVDEVLSVSIRAGDRAVSRVAGSLAKTARSGDPATVAFVLPLAIGGHIDHRVVRQAGVEALGSVGCPVAFYEDLPYAARAGEEESATARVGELTAELDLALEPWLAARAADDTQAAVKRKRRVAECYDSQVDSEVVDQIAEFCVRYDGRERLWATPTWAAHPAFVQGEKQG